VNVDDTFRKLHGKSPSDDQRQWMLQVQGALGLGDNDAFWFVVMMLEHYDGLYRGYPRTIAEETTRAIEGARQAFGEAAKAEAALAQRRLAEEVAKTSVTIAEKLAERPFRIHRVTAAVGLLVLFGGLCVTAGFELAGTDHPFWVKAGSHGAGRAIAAVLGAPAGWMAFALMLPAAVHGLRSGWGAAADAVRLRDRAAGWGLMAISVMATAACALMLAKMV
jgi:hypothetical protein